VSTAAGGWPRTTISRARRPVNGHVDMAYVCMLVIIAPRWGMHCEQR
jgi:hypothetical protein